MTWPEMTDERDGKYKDLVWWLSDRGCLQRRRRLFKVSNDEGEL